MTKLQQSSTYAEAGEVTALVNLALNFKDRLPNVVAISSAGVEQTFTYVQLARLQYWDAFLAKEHSNCTEAIRICPFLQSANLQGEEAIAIVDEARNNALSNYSKHVLASACIKTALENDWNEPQWTDFWFQQIAQLVGYGYDCQDRIRLSAIDQYLKAKSIKIVLLLDGLEGIFTDIASDTRQQTALQALIDNLVNKLAEISQPNLGLIIFLRRDFVRHAIKQNSAQFEDRYRAYDLA